MARHTVPTAGAHTLLLLNPPFFARHMEGVLPALERFFTAHATPPGAGAPAASPTGVDTSAGDALPPRITALVVVPAAAERRPYEVPHLGALLASPYTRAHATIPAGEHAYCQGLAHRRTRQLRVRVLSKYDTALYVLSSHAEPPTSKRTYRALLDVVQTAFRATPKNHRAGGPDGERPSRGRLRPTRFGRQKI